MAQTPIPGSRWLARRGRHAGNEVEIAQITDLSVSFKTLGGGENWGNQKTDGARLLRLSRETFLANYVDKSEALAGDTHGGVSYRRRAVAKAPPPIVAPSQPLSNNGIVMTGGTDLNIEVLEITPMTAAAWLERGGNNRPPTKTRVAKYAAAMRRGEWELDGNTIKLDADGRVCDGKHRLLAIVEAGVPIRSLVVRGIHERAFPTLDTGKNRTPGDVLGANGFENRVAVASASRGLILIEASGRYDPPSKLAYEPLLSHAAILHYAQTHPDVQEGVYLANTIRAHKLQGGSGLLGTLMTLLLRTDAEAARLFASSLGSGANLEADSPILRFRNRMIADRRLPNGIADRELTIALGLKAWNAWRAGESMNQLSWRGQRDTRFPEAFPVPV